jgi:hypothetical protein
MAVHRLVIRVNAIDRPSGDQDGPVTEPRPLKCVTLRILPVAAPATVIVSSHERCE